MHIQLNHSSYTQHHYSSSLIEKINEQLWNVNKKIRMYQHFQNIQSGTMYGLERTPALLQKIQLKMKLFGTFLDKMKTFHSLRPHLQGLILTNSTMDFLNQTIVATFLEDNIL